jgi:hypothetical protein
MTDIHYKRNGDTITKLVDTGTEPNTPAKIENHAQYRMLRVSTTDNKIIDNGTDTITIMIEAIDKLDVLQNNEQNVLNYDGDVNVNIDGKKMTKKLSGGTTSFNLTTQKVSDSIIKIVANSLSDKPAESDSIKIKVVSA